MLVLLSAVVACVAAGPVQASKGVQYGIQDDAWLEYGPGTLQQRLATFKRLGVQLVRFTLRWNEVATWRPANPSSPRDPAHHWRLPDRALRGLRRHGLTPVLTLLGTPSGRTGAPAELRPAAAARLPGLRSRRRHPLPLGALLAHLERAEQAALAEADESVDLRHHLLNPGYEAIHAVPLHARVGGGRRDPAADWGVAPVTRVRGMAFAHAKLDAYAHHPYPSSPAETPSSGG